MKKQTASAPKTSLYGSPLEISLSLHLPGQDSSAFTIKQLGLYFVVNLGIKENFNAERKPAHPLPLNPEAFI